ncbi:MAG: hypothetical protein WC796_01970 [Candidatus Pacearchaeota archaeon]|jgi:hypothetical protein
MTYEYLVEELGTGGHFHIFYLSPEDAEKMKVESGYRCNQGTLTLSGPFETEDEARKQLKPEILKIIAREEEIANRTLERMQSARAKLDSVGF